MPRPQFGPLLSNLAPRVRVALQLITSNFLQLRDHLGALHGTLYFALERPSTARRAAPGQAPRWPVCMLTGSLLQEISGSRREFSARFSKAGSREHRMATYAPKSQDVPGSPPSPGYSFKTMILSLRAYHSDEELRCSYRRSRYRRMRLRVRVCPGGFASRLD